MSEKEVWIRTDKEAIEVAYEAYQVIGALADAAGLFEHPEVIRALDYFSDGFLKQGEEILPFGAGLPDREADGQ